MIKLSTPTMRAVGRFAAVAAATFALAACGPAPGRDAIMVAAPTTGLMAVSATGSNHVRILYVRGSSIVLMRMVFMPAGERVKSVAWSNDERQAVITTSGGVLALDTRTWRIEPFARLAAVSPHDAEDHSRR